MNEYRFDPADVEFLTSWHAQGLRDMRSKGYLANYGQQGENGRWRYSARDLVAFWIADVLHGADRSVDLLSLLGKAWAAAAHVLAHIEGRPADRFSVFGWKTERLAGGLTIEGWELVPCSSLDAAAERGFVALEVLDLQNLASLATKTLIDMVGKKAE